MRSRKEALSKAHNLSLEQVEWAYALSVTLADFESLSIDRQNAVLNTLCGVPSGLDPNGFSILPSLWDDTIPASTEISRWLLQGLSQSQASQIFFSCLEQFQTEDFERAQLEAEQRFEIEETVQNNAEVSSNSDDLVIKKSLIDNSGTWIPDNTPKGRLILRIQNPFCNAVHYRTLDGSIDRVVYDYDHSTEQIFLEKWIHQDANRNQSLAMICINWKTSTTGGQQKTISGGNANANLRVESIPSTFNHQIEHQGSMECSGGHQNIIEEGGINFRTQTIQSDSQHLEHWSVELSLLHGETTPMYWNLQNVVTQRLEGRGHRGGFVSLHSNVYVQIVDEQGNYLLGTPTEQAPIEKSLLNEHTLGSRKSSRLNTWLGDPPIDFSKHVVHNEANTVPIFNSTPPIQDLHSVTTVNNGSGCKVHGLFFAELKSKVWQENTRQRVELWYQNRIESTITGSIFWNGNRLDLFETGPIRWTKADTEINIEWGVDQSRQVSTRTQPLPTTTAVMEHLQIQHTQITHQYNQPS